MRSASSISAPQALRALRAIRAFRVIRAIRALRARRALRAFWAFWALRTLRILRAFRAIRALRAIRAFRVRRALRATQALRAHRGRLLALARPGRWTLAADDRHVITVCAWMGSPIGRFAHPSAARMRVAHLQTVLNRACSSGIRAQPASLSGFERRRHCAPPPRLAHPTQYRRKQRAICCSFRGQPKVHRRCAHSFPRSQRRQLWATWHDG